MTAKPSRSDLRHALQALHAGKFAIAAASSAAWADGADLEAELIHALAVAAGGDTSAAPALARIARSHPAANHPVQDLLDLLRRHGRPAAAVPHLRAAMAEMPQDARLPALLGTLLSEVGPMADSVAAFQRAATLQPDGAAWSNLGKALAAEGWFAEADDAFRRALALAPHDPQLALNHAVVLLKSGRLAEGWAAFACRHRLPGRARPLPGPQLAGLDDLQGRTVLLQHEEGFGDTLQFIRYAPLLAGLGARVIAWVPAQLVRLIAKVPGVDAVVLPGAPPPPYDLWCPMLSLPRVFSTDLDRPPPAAPYLTADPAETARQARMLPNGLRVGVAWAGAARATDPAAAATDRVRSTTPDVLAPLGQAPGVQLVNLQFGVRAPPAMIDPMPGVRDFADTAAIIANLDVVVSVDTAVAHLAAGMGKPVLLLDRYDNCWRWLHGRTSSPWYPTLQIHRQPSPGDWAAAVASAAAALSGFRPPPARPPAAALG